MQQQWKLDSRPLWRSHPHLSSQTSSPAAHPAPPLSPQPLQQVPETPTVRADRWARERPLASPFTSGGRCPRNRAPPPRRRRSAGRWRQTSAAGPRPPRHHAHTQTHTHTAGAADGVYSGLAGSPPRRPSSGSRAKGRRGRKSVRWSEPRSAALPGGRGFLSALSAKVRGASAGCSRGEALLGFRNAVFSPGWCLCPAPGHPFYFYYYYDCRFPPLQAGRVGWVSGHLTAPQPEVGEGREGRRARTWVPSNFPARESRPRGRCRRPRPLPPPPRRSAPLLSAPLLSLQMSGVLVIAAWCFLQVESRHPEIITSNSNHGNFLDNDKWLSTVSQYDRDKYWNKFRDVSTSSFTAYFLFVPFDRSSLSMGGCWLLEAVGRRELQLGQPVAACGKDVQSCLEAGQTVLAFLIYPIDWGSLGSV